MTSTTGIKSLIRQITKMMRVIADKEKHKWLMNVNPVEVKLPVLKGQNFIYKVSQG